MQPTDAPTRTHDAVAAVLLGLCAFALWWRSWTISPTVDEPYHLLRGMAWWWTDSAKLSYAHPPLANLIQAWPATWMSEPLDIAGLPGWEQADHSKMANRLFRTDYETVRPLLMAGRVMQSVLGWSMAAVTYLWTSRRLGGPIGLFALALVAFNPTLLAHSQIVTTDTPVAFAMLGVALTFADYLKPPGEQAWRRGSTLAWFSGAVAIAMCTKFTALALVPVLGLLGLIWAAAGWGRFAELGPWPMRLARVVVDMVVVALVSLLSVGAIYGFEDWGLTVGEILAMPEPQCHLTDDFSQDFLEQRPTVTMLPEWLPLPVPFSWYFGMEMVRYHGEHGHLTWFMGDITKEGHWQYFPLMVLIKTPPVLWLGLLLAAVRPLVRRQWPHPVMLILTALVLFFLTILSRSNLNIGVRHALPVMPMLAILASGGFALLVEKAPERLAPAARWGLAAALLATAPVATLWNAGHYLSWFSIGDRGYDYSIVGEDWGQDVYALAEAVKAEKPVALYYNTYGLAAENELEHLGVEFVEQPCRRTHGKPGWAAIHRANVVRRKHCTRPVKHRPPDRIINDHIFIWETPAPEPGSEAGG